MQPKTYKLEKQDQAQVIFGLLGGVSDPEFQLLPINPQTLYMNIREKILTVAFRLKPAMPLPRLLARMPFRLVNMFYRHQADQLRIQEYLVHRGLKNVDVAVRSSHRFGKVAVITLALSNDNRAAVESFIDMRKKRGQLQTRNWEDVF